MNFKEYDSRLCKFVTNFYIYLMIRLVYLQLEAEVEDLRRRLQAEVNKQDDQMERLDREKQEERNLVSMLREDIERLNGDR